MGLSSIRAASRAPQLQSSARAFTLIEILVAVGITAVLAAFIVTIVTNVSGFWSRTSGRISAEAQGRFILDQVSLDLQGALFHDDGNTWLAATIPANINNTGFWTTTGSTPAALKPANNAANTAASLASIATGSIADARFGIAGTWLRFFTTKRGGNATLANVSAPVAVSYQIVRRATSGNEGRSTDRRYLLHRAEVRPGLANNRAGTFESGFDVTAAAYTTRPASLQTGDPAEVRYPSINTVIAENVIDFGLRFHVRDASSTTGLRQVFPLTNTSLSYNARSPASSAETSDAFPEVIDVMVRVLTDEGARILFSYETGKIPAATGRTAQQYWWDLALAHSRVFTRRVIVNGQPI